jgi:hypothetical protein
MCWLETCNLGDLASVKAFVSWLVLLADPGLTLLALECQQMMKGLRAVEPCLRRSGSGTAGKAALSTGFARKLMVALSHCHVHVSV